MNTNVFGWARGVVADFVDGPRAAQRFERLSAMSDATLASKGFRRADLPAVARNRAGR